MKRSTKKKSGSAYALTRFKTANQDRNNSATIFDALNLKHFWQNAEDPREVIFLLSTNDLNTAKQFIKKNRTNAGKAPSNLHYDQPAITKETRVQD